MAWRGDSAGHRAAAKKRRNPFPNAAAYDLVLRARTEKRWSPAHGKIPAQFKPPIGPRARVIQVYSPKRKISKTKANAYKKSMENVWVNARYLYKENRRARQWKGQKGRRITQDLLRGIE